MTLARRLARPMLASIFISGGADAFLKPAPKAAMAGDVPNHVADALPISLPDQPESLVKIDAAAKVVGGLLLAGGGRFSRVGAVICAASLVPTTLAAHRFWALQDPKQKAQQQIQFMKNLSIFGGLVIAALDTGGRESLPHRARRGAASLSEKAGDLLPQ